MSDRADLGVDDANDEKYVVFKREVLTEELRHRYGPEHLQKILDMALADAVVIRRQDLFASPALAAYAGCIGIVMAREQDPDIKGQLAKVADYFQRQSELAGEEGWKLPSP